MKILIIGLGSIGRRHLKVLQDLGGVEVAALRTKKGTLRDETGIEEFDRLEAALEFRPDGVIVANPTSLHVESAKPFLNAGSKVLIEKPIAHSREKAMELAEFANRIRVAYCMRFLPVSEYFRNELDLEKVYKLSFKRSFYLPKWHPYADYRQEYTARKELGGGVIRTLSHEIDLACHWLGIPEKVTGVVDHLSHLELDVDDFALLSMKMKNGARANLEMDYFAPVNVNEGELFDDLGKYFWNGEALLFTPYGSATPQTLLKFEDVYTEMYYDQMKDFIRFIESGTSVNCTFEEALAVSQVIEEVERQSYGEQKQNSK